MSFSQEMKDFLNAAQAGQKINASRTDQDYKEAQTDATKKKTTRDNDPDTLELQDKQARATLANTTDQLATNAANRAHLAATTNYSNVMADRIKNGAVPAVDPGTGLLPPAPGVGPMGPQPPNTAGALPIGPSTMSDDPAYADGGLVPLPRSDPREGASDVRRAYDDLRTTPPVTIMEDLVGRMSQSKGESNAVRDAIRQKATNDIKAHPDVSDPVAAYRANRYADGGIVPDDDDDNDDGTTPAATGAVNLSPEVSDANARAPTRGLNGIVSPQLVHDATRAGLAFGANAYGLKGTGAVQTPEQKARAQLLVQGHNGLSDAEMQAAKKAVDPEGKLTDSQRNMAALGSVYQYWTNKGENDKAEKVAFQMLQHYRNATQRYAAISAHAAQTGDLDLATKAAVKAYANVPDGKDVHIEKDPDNPQRLIYYYTDENGNDVAKGIATPQQLAASAMGLASGGFDKAILSAAGQREADAKPKGAVHVQSANDRAKESEIASGASTALKDAYAAKNKDAPGSDEYWNEHKSVTQHILQQNKSATPEEAARAAHLMLSPGTADPDKLDFKVKAGEEGEPNTVDIGGKLKLKLDDDQLNAIMNSRATRVKAANDKINKDMEDSDKPTKLEQAGEAAKQIGRGVLDVGRDAGKAVGAVGEIAKNAVPDELVQRGKVAIGRVVDDVSRATRNPGAIPVDDNDRPL